MRIPFLTAAIAVLVLAACPSPQAKAPESPAVDSVTVESLTTIPTMADSNATIDIYWTQRDDGRGPLSGFLVYGSDNAGLHADTLNLPATARSARIVLGPYPSGTYTGQACVVALRRQINSTPSCRTWTKTFAAPTIPAPPMPLLTALVPSVVEDTVRLQFSVDDVADANGVSTALIIRAGDNQNIDKDSVQVAITSTSVTIKLAKYGYGTTPSGYGCVSQIRNGLVGAARCLSWSILVPDIPPPEPIFDSLILRLEEVAYINGSTTGVLGSNESLYMGQALTLENGTGTKHGVCVFAILKNGKVGMKQPDHFYRNLRGTGVVAPQFDGCRNLYNTRYTSTQRALTTNETWYLQNRLECLHYTVSGAHITTTRPKFQTFECDTVTVTPSTLEPVVIVAHLK